MDFVGIGSIEPFLSEVVFDAEVLEFILHLLQDLFSCWIEIVVIKRVIVVLGYWD